MTQKITVVTPTFNRADLLPKTIDSVLNQSVRDYEYYIIDDGSTDDTRQVVAPYLSDSRIKYVFQENAGEPAAVNHGWRLAKGEYVVVINSDDPVMPTLFEEMTTALDANPQAIVAYSDFYFIDENDQITQTVYTADWDFHALLSLFSCVAAVPGAFFRKTGPLSKWEGLRRNNYRHINDVEMYWDMALEGDFVHVPKLLTTWREHAGQISHTRYEAVEEIWRWFEYYFNKPDLPKEVLACRSACQKSMLAYSVSLILESELDEQEKLRRIYTVQKEQFLEGNTYSCLQVGDHDLTGRIFNGYDLHLSLGERNINAWQIVRMKASHDEKR